MKLQAVVPSVNSINDLFIDLSPNQQKLYEVTPRLEAWSVTQLSKELTRCFLVKMTDVLIHKELIAMVGNGLVQKHRNNTFKRAPVIGEVKDKNVTPVILGVVSPAVIDTLDDKLSEFMEVNRLDISMRGLVRLIGRADKYAIKLSSLRMEIESFSEELEWQIIDLQKDFDAIRSNQIDPEQLKKFEHFKALMDIK
jgi:hypothetical protein